jgi:flagellar protein FlbD
MMALEMQTSSNVIELTRMNDSPLMLNADLIEFVEVVPDTIITLTGGQKLMVRESAGEIRQKVIAFRREIFRDLFSPAPDYGRAANNSR